MGSICPGLSIVTEFYLRTGTSSGRGGRPLQVGDAGFRVARANTVSPATLVHPATDDSAGTAVVALFSPTKPHPRLARYQGRRGLWEGPFEL